MQGMGCLGRIGSGFSVEPLLEVFLRRQNGQTQAEGYRMGVGRTFYEGKPPVRGAVGDDLGCLS